MITFRRDASRQLGHESSPDEPISFHEIGAPPIRENPESDWEFTGDDLFHPRTKPWHSAHSRGRDTFSMYSVCRTSRVRSGYHPQGRARDVGRSLVGSLLRRGRRAGMLAGAAELPELGRDRSPRRNDLSAMSVNGPGCPSLELSAGVEFSRSSFRRASPKPAFRLRWRERRSARARRWLRSAHSPRLLRSSRPGSMVSARIVIRTITKNNEAPPMREAGLLSALAGASAR